MAVMAIFVLTESQRAAVMALNTNTFKVDPRLIDNPLANNLGYGVLVGKYMLPARIINDPNMTQWYDMLGSLPIYTFDMDVLFVPNPDDL